MKRTKCCHENSVCFNYDMGWSLGMKCLDCNLNFCIMRDFSEQSREEALKSYLAKRKGK